MTYHWDGRNWRKVDREASGGYLDAETNLWVEGRDEFVERRVGTTWQRGGRAPSRTKAFLVSNRAPNDVFLRSGRDGDIINHWDGVRWTALPKPARGGRYAFFDASPFGDIWAVGYLQFKGSAVPRTWHWADGDWHAVAAPNFRSRWPFLLRTVEAVGRYDAWAIAGNASGQNLSSAVTHWDGRVWSILWDSRTNSVRSFPAENHEQTGALVPDYEPTVHDVAAAASGVWLAGTVYDAHGGHEPLLLHRSGARWTQVSVPGTGDRNFFALASLPDGEMWAVGDRILARFRPCAVS